jgi:hypothetical protein
MLAHDETISGEEHHRRSGGSSRRVSVPDGCTIHAAPSSSATRNAPDATVNVSDPLPTSVAQCAPAGTISRATVRTDPAGRYGCEVVARISPVTSGMSAPKTVPWEAPQLGISRMACSKAPRA